MASVLRMPSMLAGVSEAVIANWRVAPGDAVTAGDPIAEIETEKALVEFTATESGTVGRLLLAAGEGGAIGEPIAVLVHQGETDADIDAALSGDGAGLSGGAGGAVLGGGAVMGGDALSRSRVFASPLVRKIAREQGIDLVGVEGTGPGGRIVRRDIERLGKRQAPAEASPAGAPPAGASPAEASPAEASPAGASPVGTVIPHTPIRRAIARRVTESKASTPHFYLTTECVVDELLELRKRINETAPVKISINDFVIVAVAAAFGDVPEANVTWSEQGLVVHQPVDISLAVATDDGLVTPVLRDVQARRLSDIAREAQALAGRARDRRLLQHELEGGSFSVSNLGMYGTLEFAAIINPPQSGILAVGAAKPQPVVVDGAVTAATVIRCTLSVDHRAIDGALAARWLAAFTTRMQNPMGMIV